MAHPITTSKSIHHKHPLHLRHEFKHPINPIDDMELTSRLRKLFRHDANADSHGTYRVSSLYFDTPYDKALRQKVDGVNCREKFRLRHYNGNLDFIRLEKKMKINGLCAKHSARVTKEQVERILQGDIDFLLESENPLLLEFYSKLKGQLLKPKTLVCYDREAFLYEPGNVRITLDRNLRTAGNAGGAGGLGSGGDAGADAVFAGVCAEFLNPDPAYMDVSDGQVVLEVKYDEFLPEIVRMAVQTPNRRESAFSKYAICRRYE